MKDTQKAQSIETGNKYLDEIYNSQLWKDIEENFEYFNECIPHENIRDFYKRLIWELANRAMQSQSDLVSKEKIIEFLQQDAKTYKQHGDHIELSTIEDCISKIKSL